MLSESAYIGTRKVHVWGCIAPKCSFSLKTTEGNACASSVAVVGGGCRRVLTSGLGSKERINHADFCITIIFYGTCACKRTPSWLVPAGQEEAQAATASCLAFLLCWLDGSAAVAKALLDRTDALNALVGCLTTRWACVLPAVYQVVHLGVSALWAVSGHPTGYVWGKPSSCAPGLFLWQWTIAPYRGTAEVCSLRVWLLCRVFCQVPLSASSCSAFTFGARCHADQCDVHLQRWSSSSHHSPGGCSPGAVLPEQPATAGGRLLKASNRSAGCHTHPSKLGCDSKRGHKT